MTELAQGLAWSLVGLGGGYGTVRTLRALGRAIWARRGRHVRGRTPAPRPIGGIIEPVPPIGGGHHGRH